MERGDPLARLAGGIGGPLGGLEDVIDEHSTRSLLDSDRAGVRIVRAGSSAALASCRPIRSWVNRLHKCLEGKTTPTEGTLSSHGDTALSITKVHGNSRGAQLW